MTIGLNRRGFVLGASLMAMPRIGLAQGAADYNFVHIAAVANQWVAGKLLHHVYERADLMIDVEAMPGKRALAEAISGNKDGEAARV